MRKLIVLTSILTLLPLSAHSAAESFTIDPSHTYPHFKINHLGFSTMQGRFNETSGKLTIDMTNKTGSVDITIQAASIDTAHKKRDKHLRSPDFLNTAEFPEITYKSTTVMIHDDKSVHIDGNLTIMGTTKPVSLHVDAMNCGIHPFDPKKQKYVCGFDAMTTIKRSDFGITYGLPGIGDEMELFIEVEAVRD